MNLLKIITNQLTIYLKSISNPLKKVNIGLFLNRWQQCLTFAGERDHAVRKAEAYSS